jgi:hypothetical protein
LGRHVAGGDGHLDGSELIEGGKVERWKGGGRSEVTERWVFVTVR